MPRLRPRAIAAIVLIGWVAGASVGECSAASAHTGTSGRMAFVNRQGAVNHIFLMDVNAAGVGVNVARLTGATEAENYPSWSPDGKRLAYQRDFNGSALYVVDADGTGQQRLSPTPGFDAAPSWSADGRKIVYVRLLAVPQPNVPPLTDIRVMNADGSDDHANLANTVFSVEPRWSVNDKIVLMSYPNGPNLHVHVVNADGTGLTPLTSGGNNGDPVWSPDGGTITFGSDREGGNKLNVFAMNADGSGQVSTGVPCSNVGCAPRWQPKVTPTVDVIEYYDARRDHYFIASLPVEINALDAGQFPGWARTGLSFRAFAQPVGNAGPVCRLYIPPGHGDSHFYSAAADECAVAKATYPFFVEESANVMYVDPPDRITGACPPGDLPVYRMWNARVDSNHRDTTLPGVRAQMVAKGWVAEGYGADQVIMCANP